MKKKIEQGRWVMLPAERNGAIEINTTTKSWSLGSGMLQSSCIKPHHLYLTSDEDAEEGSYVTDGKVIKIVEYSESSGYSVMYNGVGYGDYDFHTLNACWDKVIATTDKSLTTGILPNKANRVINVETEKEYQLPQILENMVKYYVEKQGKVDDVEVEYYKVESGVKQYKDDRLYFDNTTTKVVFKLTENNEIIVHIPSEAYVNAIKDIPKDIQDEAKAVLDAIDNDMYTKEDVIGLMITSFYTGMSCESCNFDITDQVEQLIKKYIK